MHRTLLLAVVTTSLCRPAAYGRGLQSWSPERLRKEADVAVIATAIASKDSSSKLTWHKSATPSPTTSSSRPTATPALMCVTVTETGMA